jgi:hypothetical protein
MKNPAHYILSQNTIALRYLRHNLHRFSLRSLPNTPCASLGLLYGVKLLRSRLL